MTRPHFCHEDSSRPTIDEFTGGANRFSILKGFPLVLINRLISNYANKNVASMSVGSFTPEEVATITPPARRDFFMDKLCPPGKPPAFKIYFPGYNKRVGDKAECGGKTYSTNTPVYYNCILTHAIAAESAWLMVNYKKPSP
jgi:hypothetical protein